MFNIINWHSFVTSIAFLLFSSCNDGDKKETDNPNIIYILADDLGYGELGCYGQEKIETPNIDKLASKGVVFTDHYSGAPVCAPARGILLTGKHAGHAYIRSNDPWAERGNVMDFEAAINDPYLEGQRPLKEGTATIGTILQKVGYRTAIIGKWGLGAPNTNGIPNAQGFDYFYGYNCQRQAHTYFPVHLWENEDKVLLDNKLVIPGKKLPDGVDIYSQDVYSDYWLNDYAPELMQKEALQFISENKEDPFFLYYASPLPHMPLQAPKHWIDYYVQKFGDEEPYLGDDGYFPHRYPRACYAAMISYLDEQVGEIVQKLEDLNLLENTLIIFSSDNGPTYNGGSDAEWFKSASPLVTQKGRTKGNLYEGGIRIPMVAAWKGKIKEGRKTDLLSAHYDILPTICDLVGAEIPDQTDGISFLPELLGNGIQQEHKFLYWEFPAAGGQQAVRLGKWKGLRQNIREGNLKFALYDLENDVLEKNDLYNQHPEIVNEIKAIFNSEHEPAEIEAYKMPQLGD
ncbi:MAG TPA: arylsulfatase [Mariniphaga sp.]|nr:arylsulfatase [Mariniphaga sp.]